MKRLVIAVSATAISLTSACTSSGTVVQSASPFRLSCQFAQSVDYRYHEGQWEPGGDWGNQPVILEGDLGTGSATLTNPGRSPRMGTVRETELGLVVTQTAAMATDLQHYEYIRTPGERRGALVWAMVRGTGRTLIAGMNLGHCEEVGTGVQVSAG